MTRKRRKVSSEKENNRFDDLEKFRSKIVSMLLFSEWKEFYMKLMTKEEIGKYELEEKPKMQSIYGLKFFSRKYNVPNEKKKGLLSQKGFARISSEEKIAFILKSTPRIFESVLLRFSKSDILSYCGKYFAKNGVKVNSMGREMCIKTIVTTFFQIETIEEKREVEKTNMGDDTMFISITLCGMDIPRDLILEIFSYLTYDFKLITTVGSVSKEFYLSLLSTWPSVQITKRNIWSISLLVLQNVRKIVILESLVRKDLNHLFSCLQSTNKIQELHFFVQRGGVNDGYTEQATVLALNSFFNSLHQWFVADKDSKNRNPFVNVRKLVFPRMNDLSETELSRVLSNFENSKRSNISSYKLKDFFPSLRVLDEPIYLPMLLDPENDEKKMDSVRDLSLTLSWFKERINSYWKNFVNHYPMEHISKFLSPSLGNSVQRLLIRNIVPYNHPKSSPPLVKKILEQFERVDVLSLRFVWINRLIVNSTLDSNRSASTIFGSGIFDLSSVMNKDIVSLSELNLGLDFYDVDIIRGMNRVKIVNPPKSLSVKTLRVADLSFSSFQPMIDVWIDTSLQRIEIEVISDMKCVSNFGKLMNTITSALDRQLTHFDFRAYRIEKIEEYGISISFNKPKRSLVCERSDGRGSPSTIRRNQKLYVISPDDNSMTMFRSFLVEHSLAFSKYINKGTFGNYGKRFTHVLEWNLENLLSKAFPLKKFWWKVKDGESGDEAILVHRLEEGGIGMIIID